MPADAIVAPTDDLGSGRALRVRLPSFQRAASCSRLADPDQCVALAHLRTMVGSWPPETAGGGCRYGRERLEPFSLDNVTAGSESEGRLWPRQTLSRRA